MDVGKARRYERWMLLAVSREVIGSKRLALCHRAPASSEVEVWKSVQGRASYHKVQTCGSVWLCPVCSAKVSEKRRGELAAAMAANKAQDEDGYTWLLTLTFPHSQADDLQDLLRKLSKARKLLTSGEYWEKFKKLSGLVGTVTALEVTHGANGWHPHLHILGFTQGVWDYHFDPDFLLDLRGYVLSKWKKACVRVGLPEPSDVYGVDLRNGDAASDYVAKFGDSRRKWTGADELTKSHVKQGKGKGRTPWDLLRSIAADGEAGDVALFQEYAEAFKGQKQLRWSPGLRKRLGLLDEASDEQIAQEAGEGATQLGTLTLDQWRWLVAGGWKRQVTLLDVAEDHGWSGVVDFLGAGGSQRPYERQEQGGKSEPDRREDLSGPCAV